LNLQVALELHYTATAWYDVDETHSWIDLVSNADLELAVAGHSSWMPLATNTVHANVESQLETNIFGAQIACADWHIDNMLTMPNLDSRDPSTYAIDQHVCSY